MMRRITFLIYILVFSFLFTGIALSGDKDGKRSNERRVRNINISELTNAHNPPVPFMSALSESFEGSTFPPAGWTRYKFTGSTDPGWERDLAGNGPLPGWNGGNWNACPGGGTAMAFVTYNGSVASNDEWLITPQITNVQPNDSLRFYMSRNGYTNAYRDNVDIKISTTNNQVASFTITVALVQYQPNGADTGWVAYGYNMGSLVSPGANIYVGWREHVVDNLNDGAAIQLDLVSVTGNPVGIGSNNGEIPKSYRLNQNYPNPFNPSTNINFGLPKSGNAKLVVYDVLGNEVAVVVNEFKQAGSYSVNFDASKLSSGVYFYKLTSGDFSQTMKMSLIK